jgi:hypothetical protein
MATVTKDISGFRLPFAICAAIIAVLLGVAVATRMGALLLGFHTFGVALRVPELFGLPERIGRVRLAESGIGRRYEGYQSTVAVRLGAWRVEILRPETFGPSRASKRD